jgi:hypothetical protein
MSETTSSSPLARMLTAFLGILLFGHVLLTGIAHYFPDLKMPNSIGLIIVAAAATYAGQFFARSLGRGMFAKEKFTFALVATILGIALTACVVWAQFAYYGVPFSVDNVLFLVLGDTLSAEEKKMVLWVGGGVGSIVSVIVCYFGCGFGAKSYLKQLQRQAAKSK